MTVICVPNLTVAGATDVRGGDGGVQHHGKVDIRQPEKTDSNSHGARPVHQNRLDDSVDSDQWVVNKELSPCSITWQTGVVG